MSIINLKSETDFSGFYVVYEGSCVKEREGIYGISHLMEHLVCKSLDDFQDDFQRDGISHNAYTSDNEIVFHWTGLEDKLNKYRNLIIEKIFDFNITEEQLKTEKDIVMEEYLDWFNEQSSSHIQNLYRKLFNYYSPIGKRQDIESWALKDCQDYFDLQYKRPHKIINVSKHNDFKTDIEFETSCVGGIFEYGNHKAYIEKLNDFKGKTSLWNLSPIIHEDFASIKFVCTMLGRGLNSPLYQEIREKEGLVYYLWCYLQRINNHGIINIATATSPENVDKLQDIVASILGNKEKFLTKAYRLGKPFAFLLPLTTFETKKRQQLFLKFGLEVIFFDKRINFEGINLKNSGSWFSTAWFTNGLNIGKQI